MVSSLRGVDSAGAVLGHRTNKSGHNQFNYFKLVGNSLELVMDPTFKKMISDHRNRFMLMGHTRAATTGDVTKDNAQPVIRSRLVGCHNGTINALGDKDRSDSVELYELIEQNGIEATLPRIRWGAYALVWSDLRTNKMHILKNDKRPLFLMYTKGRGTMLWASEDTFLNLIADRSGTPAMWEEPIAVENDTLYTFDLAKPGKRTEFSTKPMAPPPFVAPAPPPVPIVRLPGPSTGTTSGMDGAADRTSAIRRFVERRKADAGGKNVSFIVETMKDKWMGKHNLQHILRHGCTLCSGKIDVSKDVYWIDGMEPVCGDCHTSQHGLIHEYIAPARYYKGNTSFFQLNTKD